MKWSGITGSWRKTNDQLENEVRQTVWTLITQGGGIVTGGALGVDWIALDEGLKNDPPAQKIRVFIPAPLEKYAAHYRQRANEGVITLEQAEKLIAQLTTLKKINSSSLIENQSNVPIEKTSYYDRNSEVVAASDELFAFQVNKSQGTQDTIEKARAKGIPVTTFTYDID